MSLGQRHWTARWISQVLCCAILLQTGTLAAGYLPAPLDRREWMSDERLAELVKADLPMEPRAVAGTDEVPEPVPSGPAPARNAALQERPVPPKGMPPLSVLTDSAGELEVPAARSEPVKEREEPPAPVEIRPDDLPPFPPEMGGAVQPRTPVVSAAGTPQALSASSLIPGWNLGSVQNEPVDKSPSAVFSSISGQFTRVFAYDACTPGDPWKVYDPADAAGSDLTQVDQRIGFWAEMSAPAAMPNPGTLADETAIHLCPGWNLIGFPAEQPRPVRTALSSIEGKYTRVFGFDPADSADPWEFYDVAVPSWANDLDLMQPGRGYWVLATAEADLTISNDGAEPEVALTAPADLAVVTAPTEVRGTVTSDRLKIWALSYRGHGESESTVFATGTTPVVNGRLGTLDPTLLLNGGYTIELTAEDFNGQIVTVAIDVSVEGQMKIGNFTLSFLDLEIPLSGLPIQVYRNYDSRDKRRGDFGIGWTLALRSGTYRNNRKPGDGWQFAEGFLPCQNIGETRSHVTTIRLSDQEVYRFKLALASGVPTLGGCFAQARFDFVDGPTPGATLAILGNTQVLYENGANFVASPDSLEVFEPRQVRLTTRDGRIFDLDLQAGVTRLEDLNGNTLSITPGGISHSSGLSVAFQRDGQGRIARITDPLGASTAYSYEAAGDLVAVTDREENTARFGYRANHYLESIEDPLGRQPVRNEYDAAGRLIRTTDVFEKSIELSHDLAAHREVITNRLGHSRTLEYDDRGNVVRETDALGKTTIRTYDENDRLLSETDPLGHSRLYTYDASQNLTEVKDPLGHRLRYTHDARGQVLTTTDPLGKVTSNVYDSAGNLLEVRDPLGNVTVYSYDSKGNLLSETDAEGAQTSRLYDAFGNLIQETDPLGTVTTSTYDANGSLKIRATQRTTPVGTQTLTWTYEYDAVGRLVKSTDPDGSVTRSVFDAAGNLIESVDKLGRSNTFTYDELGRLVQTRHPDGTTESSTYDAESRRLTSMDRGGRVTSYAYEAMGRLLATTTADGAVVSNAYDAAGRLVATTDALGHTTAFEHDAAGRRTRVRDALGKETIFGYDANSNQTSVVDARNATTGYEYDDANRLVRVRLPDGTSSEIAYDRVGRKGSETDPAGLTTRYGYDLLGRLLTVTDALNQVTRYAYDEQDNRTEHTDANGHTTRFEYDPLGRMVRRILPDGASEELTYDAAGRLLSRKDFSGRVTTFDHDLSDRLVQKTYPDGTGVSFTYTPAGRRKTSTDSLGTTTWSYDQRDRVQEITGPGDRRLTYSYDAHGNRTELKATVAGQVLTTRFVYDALNRLDQVIDPRGRIYDHDYDANGNRSLLLYPNGVGTGYQYDSRNRLRELTTRQGSGAVLQSHVYTLGPAGNRTRVDEHGGTSRSYTYDALYRLVRESVAGGPGPGYEKTFDYDAGGNRVRQSHTSTQETWTREAVYDSRDRLQTLDGNAWTWDANGNLTAKGGEAAYGWDPEDRLKTSTLADGTVVAHVYDADGDRVRTMVTPPAGPPEITEYLVDPSGGLSQVVAETDGSGNLKAFYVRGNDLLAVLRATGDRFYHADGLGSVRALTDGSGTVTDRYSFEAFGELLGHQGTDPNAYLFGGEALDPNTGFYYLRARWMDPAAGRFASLDPLTRPVADPAALHTYLYASADPVSKVDPTGLFTMADINVVLGNIATVSRSVVNVLQAVDKAKAFIDTINSIMGLLEAFQSGGLAPILNNAGNVLGPEFDPGEAAESVARNLPKILSRSFNAWSTWLVTNGRFVKGLAIYLPTPRLIPLPEIPIPTGQQIGRFNVILVSGGRKHRGRLMGVGFDTKGRPGPRFNQMWRVDHHGFHGFATFARTGSFAGKEDLATWPDPPFHYHVLRTPE